MAEHRPAAGAGANEPDCELDLRGLAGFLVALGVVLVVTAALMWGLSVLLREEIEARDPAPPVLPEARTPLPPPEPRLQTHPEADLRRLRSEEEAVLDGYAWVDRAAGVARIPIERAMELVAEGRGGVARGAQATPEGH